MEKVIEVYLKSADPQAAAEDFEAIELRMSDVVKETGREMLRGIIESRDDGAARLGRDGKPWYRVEPTRKEIMTSLGSARYMRPRYRRDSEACALVPVDNSLGLVEDYMTRPAAYLAVTMMGHCTAREAESFFARMGGMTSSVSTLQRVTKALHKDLESLVIRCSGLSMRAAPYCRRRSSPRFRWTASWCRCGLARTAARTPPGARSPAARSPSTMPMESACTLKGPNKSDTRTEAEIDNDTVFKILYIRTINKLMDDDWIPGGGG